MGYDERAPLLEERRGMSEIAWLGTLDEALQKAHDGERLVLMDVFNPT
jgi:hypothetical protein